MRLPRWASARTSEKLLRARATGTGRLFMRSRYSKSDARLLGGDGQAAAPVARAGHDAERRRGQRKVLILGINGVPPARAVPLGDAGRVLHLLDDLPEADPGIVSAERDLPELGAVRDDAHFGAPEVVVEEILKPHAGHEQEAPLEVG